MKPDNLASLLALLRQMGYEVKEGKVILTLDQPLRPVSANELEVAGADGRFVNAEATVDGKVVCTADLMCARH